STQHRQRQRGARERRQWRALLHLPDGEQPRYQQRRLRRGGWQPGELEWQRFLREFPRQHHRHVRAAAGAKPLRQRAVPVKALAVLLALVPLTVHGGAGFPPERLLLSTDMSVDSGIGTLAAHALLHAAGDGSAQSVQAVPASLWANGANLTALAVRPGSGGSLEHWFAFDVAMAIADGQTLAPGRPFRCLDADCAAIELLP